MSGWPYDVWVLPLDKLFVDHTYQRPGTSLVQSIADDWDPSLAGTLTGSLRKLPRGKPVTAETLAKASVALIDGQQRWLGALENGSVEVLPVILYQDLSLSDEAYIYAEMQRRRRQMTSQERVRAQMQAPARYPVHALIASAIEETGFKLGTKTASKTDAKVLTAAAALERVYAWGAGASLKTLQGGDPTAGHAILVRVLTVLREGFPAQPTGYVAGDMIRGLGAFLTREYDVTIDDERLIRKLKTTTPEKIRTRANQLLKGFAVGGSSAGYMADAFFAVYSR